MAVVLVIGVRKHLIYHMFVSIYNKKGWVWVIYTPFFMFYNLKFNVIIYLLTFYSRDAFT